MIFPNGISDKLRTAITFSAGNVYQTHGIKGVSYEKFRFSNLRTSVGLMISWYSPMGPLELSVARALNTKPGDDEELIGFNFGTSL